VGTLQNLSRGSPFLCNLLFLFLVVLVLDGRGGRRQGGRDEVKGGVARELRMLRSELSEEPRLALFAREAETTAHPSDEGAGARGTRVRCGGSLLSVVKAEVHSPPTSQLWLSRGPRWGGEGAGTDGRRRRSRAAGRAAGLCLAG